MNKFFIYRAWLILGLCGLGDILPASAQTMTDGGEEQTLSPYLWVNNAASGGDPLPLKSTAVKVHIAGVIADVEVEQHYRNEGALPLEARYVFPASVHAAVYGMQMHIGDRVVTAQIREKNQARRDYEVAKANGQSASLLEQQRPNVFQMNVANILPGDEVAVTLHYTETVIPKAGQYQFVFPAVVGPRYNGEPAPGSKQETWPQMPFLPQGQTSNATWAMTVDIVSPLPLQDLASGSHAVAIEQTDVYHAALTLPASTRHGNRDFVLDYRLAGEGIQSGTLLYQGGTENFFMTLVQPPKHVSSSEIVPREYIFIVDVSGSMHGFPLDTAKTLLRALIGSLRPTDTFNVLLFSGASEVLAEQALPATQESIDQALAFINRKSGGGGTELLPALRRALAMEPGDSRSRNFVVVSDGYVAVEKEAFDLIRDHLHEANLFAFGIGSSVNRFLMSGLARAGKGEAFIVTQPGEAASTAAEFKRYLESPVWTHLRLDIQGLDAYDVQPAKLPDLFAERPLVITGKWRGKAHGTVSITGETNQGEVSQSVVVDDHATAGSVSALRYLWARERIADLGDYRKLQGGDNDALIRELTDLGLKYHLLTDYTSFVAIDERVRSNGQNVTVDQPNPLPQGVSELALGIPVASSPEPEFFAMMAMAAGIGAVLRRRGKKHGR